MKRADGTGGTEPAEDRPAQRWPRHCGLALLLAAGLASIPTATPAVIIASGDGTGNTEPPTDDPGFRNVGDAGRTAVYLGNGWVISANHALVSDVVLAGVTYRAIPGSRFRLVNSGDGLPPDLAMLKLYPIPDLPALPIRSVSPEPHDPVVLIGIGRNRGEPTQYQGFRGWHWGTGRAMRWGTNHVLATRLELSVGKDDATVAFSTDFTPWSPSDHEAQVAVGDSGGAAFAKRNGRWELAGILVASGDYDGQPPKTVVFGNRTFIADLSVYRDQILARVSTPACRDGLDDDGDDLIDHPADPGCSSPDDATEGTSSE